MDCEDGIHVESIKMAASAIPFDDTISIMLEVKRVG
jgi:hypothetical protein